MKQPHRVAIAFWCEAPERMIHMCLVLPGELPWPSGLYQPPSHRHVLVEPWEAEVIARALYGGA